MKKKILLMVGTRPEFLKIICLYINLKKDKNFRVYFCISGQHKSMMKPLLKMFNIKPHHSANIKLVNASLSKLTSKILLNTDMILKKIKPDLLIVHGDTATTYSSSLSAFYQKIPIAHIEAGLRTYDLQNPFPEELYRQVVSRISNFHFAPDNQSRKNLVNEKINPNKIFVTGNTIIDTLKFMKLKIKKNKIYNSMLNKRVNKILKFDYQKKKIVLITIHRRENLDKGVTSLCKALRVLSSRHKNFDFVIAVHPNPKVKEFIYNNLNNLNNIHLIKPLNYDLFLLLLMNCKFILTDSGGIQEEAPSLGKPVLVLRKKTERTKSIYSNNSALVGNETKNIIKHCSKLLYNEDLISNMSKTEDIYGDGKASIKIIKILKKLFI
jgi:UDP-N-acetylglucosamine 2-epimerase (non-hydrolysing)